MKVPFKKLADAIAERDWTKTEQELEKFQKYLGKNVLNPKLDHLERAAIFGLGFATAAARRLLRKEKP